METVKFFRGFKGRWVELQISDPLLQWDLRFTSLSGKQTRYFNLASIVLAKRTVEDM